MGHLKRVCWIDYILYVIIEVMQGANSVSSPVSLPRVARRATAFCHHSSSRAISGWLCVDKALQSSTAAKYSCIIS
jgi:hypothetical protein